MKVGLVIVSHSARLAEGVAELAAQMAPDVIVLPAGGMATGGLGTDYEAVSNALDRAESGAGVVLLYDLGSARMTAELAVESLGDPSRAYVVDAPLVEGAVAAAVAAQGDATLDGVAEAAAGAAREAFADAAETGAAETDSASAGAGDQEAGPVHTLQVTLTNEVGLHARPAALLARTLTGLTAEASVEVGDQRADARSVLGLMGLNARFGDQVVVTATGPDAEEALRRVKALVDRNFDE
ncbi:HPr family phosphocarrier protein [Solihabitans fulvus]|uniref:Phosphocarrier protein HPr n=1 Tax=Solihabitans fulvus TaxID=1892852 RepID=A0A5B2X8I3_9PSEU|nr:dihydroxyacetone kinase phosphoryl donor subunit DhaM [Solihabitans fulvus]KAA2259453.1 HPr family phosphocarrier protein [Solihabitans fulvus]